jgi:hypothetical protein
MNIAGPSRIAPRIARLPQKSILEVSGPDARKFLNGQSCKNIEALGGGYSGFLNASVSHLDETGAPSEAHSKGTDTPYMLHIPAIAHLVSDQSRIASGPSHASTDIITALQITIKSPDKGCLGRMGFLGCMGWRDWLGFGRTVPLASMASGKWGSKREPVVLAGWRAIAGNQRI